MTNYYDVGYLHAMESLGLTKEASPMNLLRSAIGVGRKVTLPAAAKATTQVAKKPPGGLLGAARRSRLGRQQRARAGTGTSTPMDPDGILSKATPEAASGLPFGLTRTQAGLGAVGAGGAGVLGYNMYQGSQPKAPQVPQQYYS
ncbi:MAG: hypothetical protein DRJ03_10900 [Chloroflexi bacterium]|nr:MAG: hypothetical protein DRJ03_10900 [Chloroflexota bacterium]